jgi:hypothetical protein
VNLENLKAATEFQRELFKTTQDQIKMVEERARNFLTLSSGSLAAVALLARPQDVLAGSLEPLHKLIALMALFLAVSSLIFVFIVYWILAAPGLVHFPEASDVEALGHGNTVFEETQAALLDGYTVMTNEAMGLLRAKSRQAKTLKFIVYLFAFLLLIYVCASTSVFLRV